jgi:hypothetical protein
VGGQLRLGRMHSAADDHAAPKRLVGGSVSNPTEPSRLGKKEIEYTQFDIR